MRDAILYVVTVKALIERVETAGREWKPVSTEKDAAYDYTPEIQKTVRREETVLEQRLDSLDISALVAVLNGLPQPEKVTGRGEIEHILT